MPAPASIWLTTVPESPKQDVEVSLVIEDEVNRSRTFPAGTPVRASFPVSDRTPYRLVAWDGACSVDFDVAAEQEADVVLTLAGDRTCELDVINLHGFDRAPHGPPTVTVEP